MWSLLGMGTAAAAREPPTALADGQATGALHIATQRPSSSRLVLDGAPLLTQEVQLAPGAHQMVAVANGFYGQSRILQIQAARKRDVNVILQTTSLPSVAVVERFLVLADSDSISMADVQSMPDHTLRAALQAKLLGQQRNAYALQHLRQDLTTLAENGDSRAAVAGFLVDSVIAGRFGQSDFDDSLLAASQHGDPMASFFYAVALREKLRGAGDISAANPQFLGYCTELDRARSQGWAEMATTWRQRDSCPE